MHKDKVVLVTGSSKGIGRAIALSFAQEKANIIINCKNSVKEARLVTEEIKKLGVKTIFVQADISKKDGVEKLRDEIKKEFGKIDVLVNNAGILRKEHPQKPNWESWDEVMQVNLKGTAMCSYILSEIMSNNSSIINLASVWGLELPAYDANAYSASKAGIVNLTKTLALQLAPKIKVNAVAPGIVATEMSHENDPETKKWLHDKIPLRRAAKPQEIADLILFLASEKAKFITGETIKIDGGLTLKI